MSKNTLTFELGGRVTLADFANGVGAFRRLVDALTPRDAGVTWVVDDLQPGSASVTLLGEANDPFAVERIVDDYERIGAALASHIPMPAFDSKVMRTVNDIQIRAKGMEYIRFETPVEDYTIYPNGNYISRPAPTPTVAIGAITGRVQTLTNRSRLRFNLYDSIFDKAVACYLSPGQEELMRTAWGRRARVSGRVYREASTGKPVTIRQIMNVEILPDVPPGSYRQARGAVPRPPGAPLAEDAIRRLRDA